MQIQPTLHTINQLLSGRLFRIPDYQRPYSWSPRQRLDLFHDIEQVAEKGGDHFFSTIVGFESDKIRISATQFDVIEVVDGQQRLTTLTILWKALEKGLSEEDKIEARLKNEIAELLVKTDNVNVVLLQTNFDSCDIFLNYVRDGEIPEGDDEPETLAEQNIVDAIAECEDFVAAWQDKTGTSLVELVDILRNRFYAIFYALGDESVVYKIFEVMNSRGLIVSWIDKLKSYLMGVVYEGLSKKAASPAINEIKATWQNIFRILGCDDDDTSEIVRFAGTMYAGTLQNRPMSEAQAVDTLVSACAGDPKKATKVAKWLLKVTRAHSQIVSNVRWKGFSGTLHPRTVGMALRMRRFDDKDSNRIYAAWEKVSFRIYGLARGNARKKRDDFFKLAWRILNEKIGADEIIAVLDEIGREFPIKNVVEELRATNCYKGWQEELRYLFFRYEEHLAKAQGQIIPTSVWGKIWAAEVSTTIEHIYPKSKRRSDSHYLGNLMLLPPGLNSSLGASLPKVKRDRYKETGLLHALDTAKSIRNGKWRTSDVKKRETALIKWVEKEWG